MLRRLFFLPLILVIISVGCAPHPRFLDEPARGRIARDGPNVKYRVGRTYSGLASYYGPEFHGRTTASGEIYDMQGLTAAHISLPFNTLLLVRNPLNGRKCKVRINDRGPHIPGRTLDLSVGAAQELGLIQTGVAELKYKILSLGDS